MEGSVVCKKKKKREERSTSCRGLREREQRRRDERWRVRECDSPSSAGEQRKDEQVINTAGYRSSALESFFLRTSPHFCRAPHHGNNTLAQ